MCVALTELPDFRGTGKYGNQVFWTKSRDLYEIFKKLFIMFISSHIYVKEKVKRCVETL